MTRADDPPVPARDGDLPGPLGWIAARPHLAALGGAMCIAFSGIFYRWSEVSPETGAMYRALFGLPFLAVIALGERRRHGPMPGRSRRLAAIAGLFFAGDLIFWHYAIGAVGAGLATVLANLQVIVVGLVAWLLLGERPSRSVLVALPVVLAGVVLISGVVGQGAYGEDPGLGVVLGLLTAVCYAGYLLVIRGVGRDLRRPAGPVTVATAATAVSAAGVGIALGTLQLTPGPSSLFWLALLGITAQFGGSLLIAVSLPRLPAVVTSIILLSQPVVTVGLAMVLLGEAPSVPQLVGVALVIGGIALATVPLDRVRTALRRRVARRRPDGSSGVRGASRRRLGIRRQSAALAGDVRDALDVLAPLVDVTAGRDARALVRRQVGLRRRGIEHDAWIAEVDRARGGRIGQGIHRRDRVELRRHHPELLEVGEGQEHRPAGLALPRRPEHASACRCRAPRSGT